MKDACTLADLGMVHVLGRSHATILRGLLHADVSRLSMHRLRSTGDVVPVGRILDALPHLPASFSEFQCRNHALAYLAYRQIAKSVETWKARLGADRIGVVIGTSTSGMDATEAAYEYRTATGRWPDFFHYETQHEMGSVAALVAALCGVRGPAYTVSTACSSGAKAFASARQLVRLGVCDAVIAGGVDTLCDLTLNGFAALGVTSGAVSMTMSKNRAGLNLGEGAALFFMTREEGAIRLCGIGESCDAYHMSAPHPEGSGARLAMTRALEDARLHPSQIRYVNLHGTGTVLNDAMEARAVASLFGDVLCSSTKPLTGHCLGAAGAIELGCCWLMLRYARRGCCPLPPQYWDEMRDDALPPLNLVKPGCTIDPVYPSYMMSNAFAFGGNNCALILGRFF